VLDLRSGETGFWDRWRKEEKEEDIGAVSSMQVQI
jgi:hypothetical protein